MIEYLLYFALPILGGVFGYVWGGSNKIDFATHMQKFNSLNKKAVRQGLKIKLYEARIRQLENAIPSDNTYPEVETDMCCVCSEPVIEAGRIHEGLDPNFRTVTCLKCWRQHLDKIEQLFNYKHRDVM